MERTVEEVATIFKNAGDSVTVINTLAALSSLTDEQKAAGQGLGYFKTAEAWDTLRSQYSGFMNYRQRSIRTCFVDCLKEDSSEQNTEWLLNTLRQECANDWTMMRKIYGVLKERLPSDNIKPDDISFRSGRLAENTVVDNLARYSSEEALLEYLRIAVLDQNNSDSYDKLFSALLDTKAQTETWKRVAKFPKDLVLNAVLDELEAKRYDGVLLSHFMSALEDNGVRYSGVEADNGNILLYALIQMLPFVLILGIAFFALRAVAPPSTPPSDPPSPSPAEVAAASIDVSAAIERLLSGM